jgi:AcrR family transcriptional regulator
VSPSRRCVFIKERAREPRYNPAVPKLWTDSIEAHRRAVADAILDTAAALVAEHGITAVSMSSVADRAGIGRATLYKYFSDVEGILAAWHERQVGAHLARLAEISEQSRAPSERLETMLETYALGIHEHRDTEIGAALHRAEHVVRGHRELEGLIRDVLAEGAETGHFRSDIGAEELATYCMHAVGAASHLPSKAAVRRLVKVTLAGVQAPG